MNFQERNFLKNPEIKVIQYIKIIKPNPIFDFLLEY